MTSSVWRFLRQGVLYFTYWCAYLGLSLVVYLRTEKREWQMGRKSSSNGSPAKETVKTLPPPEKSHILRNIVTGIEVGCDLQAWPLTLTVFWVEKVGSCAPIAFYLWGSVRAGQGVLWQGRSRNLLCLFGWAERSLAARCLLSSLWPSNSGRRTSPRLQWRGPGQHVGCSVKRSNDMAAAEHVNRCPEIT